MHWSMRDEWVHKAHQDRSRAHFENILRASTDLFSSQGFEKTTIAMISEASGVSTAAIYRRFKDKDAILRTLLDYWSKAWRDDFDAIWAKGLISDPGVEDVVALLIEIHVSAWSSDPGLLEELDRRTATDPGVAEIMSMMAQYSTDAFRRALAERIDRPESEIAGAIDRIVWIIQAAIAGLLHRNPTRSWPHLETEDAGMRAMLFDMAMDQISRL